MKLLKQTIDVPGSEPEQKPRTEEVDNPYEDPNKQVNVNITIEGGDDTLNIPPENNKEETAPTKPDEDYEVAYTEGSNDADEVMMEAFRAIENVKSIVRIMNADNFVATESIYSAARNAVFGLVNVVGHLTSLFTNTLFNGWRDFKRSELNFYVHSNIATVNALCKLRYIEVEDVVIQKLEKINPATYIGKGKMTIYTSNYDVDTYYNEKKSELNQYYEPENEFYKEEMKELDELKNTSSDGKIYVAKVGNNEYRFVIGKDTEKMYTPNAAASKMN